VYLAIDGYLLREYGPPLPRRGDSAAYERVFGNDFAEIWRVVR
jgi:hypothetical protein